VTPIIGIAGAGRMGTAFAQRLVEAGQKVRIWNRTAARLAAAVEAGVEATDLAGLAKCDIILFSLTDATAAHSVLENLVQLGIEDRLIIEMSTLLPAEVKSLAGITSNAGASYLHCPVGGTVAPALKGQLLGMAGGSATAFDQAKPVLDALCRRVERLETPEAAARMKLAVNLPLAVYWQTLGESLALLNDAGIPNDLAISLIADSSAGANVLKTRAQVVVNTMAGNDQPGTFDIAGLAKDLRLALQQASADGKALPLSALAETRYRAALEQGFGRFDGATVTRLAAKG